MILVLFVLGWRLTILLLVGQTYISLVKHGLWPMSTV